MVFVSLLFIIQKLFFFFFLSDKLNHIWKINFKVSYFVFTGIFRDGSGRYFLEIKTGSQNRNILIKITLLIPGPYFLLFIDFQEKKRGLIVFGSFFFCSTLGIII